MDRTGLYPSLGICLLWCTLSLTQPPPGCPAPCRCVALSVACNGSRLRTTPAGLPVNATLLDLGRNELEAVPSGSRLRDLPRLRTLILRENRIAEIRPGAFSGRADELRRLDLSFNRLRILERGSFAGLGNIATLILQDNTELCMDFGSLSTMPRLETLNLGKTAVEFIPGLFENSTKVSTPPTGLLELGLWKTGLREVPYEALKLLPSLRRLDLSQNGIGRLSHNVFRNNVNLTQLDLSLNPIAVIQSDSFQGLSCLSLLLLDGTGTLSRLPKGVFDPLPGDVKVCLFGNRWTCDCHLEWLKAWTEEEGRVHCAQKPNCYRPPGLQSTPINSVPRDRFTCGDADYTVPPVGQDLEVTVRTRGFCSRAAARTAGPTAPPGGGATTTTALAPAEKRARGMSGTAGLIVTSAAIVSVTALLIVAFVVRHLRIRKKLYDQTKYFNISYDNSSQLQLAESPTGDRAGKDFG